MCWALHLENISMGFTEEVIYEVKCELRVGVWQVKKKAKKIPGVYHCMSQGTEVCESVFYL